MDHFLARLARSEAATQQYVHVNGARRRRFRICYFDPPRGEKRTGEKRTPAYRCTCTGRPARPKRSSGHAATLES
eukprot:815371-Prymnesium_polylepis.1